MKRVLCLGGNNISLSDFLYVISLNLGVIRDMPAKADLIWNISNKVPHDPKSYISIRFSSMNTTKSLVELESRYDSIEYINEK